MTVVPAADATPDWVEEASRLPVAFAQVREDALLDLSVVGGLGQAARVAMVASGGCTAALLAGAANIAHLHLVDPNPAQIALTRLKLRLISTVELDTRLALLGHAPMSASLRQARLGAELTALDLPMDALGPIGTVAQSGPDLVGRYEFVFAALRRGLAGCSEQLDDVLRSCDPAFQSSRAAPRSTLGRRLDDALDEAMATPILVRLFGEEATRNPAEPFPRHFAHRLRHALASFPANRNPYLWQMLKGRYPPDHPAPWLAAPAPSVSPRITWAVGLMDDELCAAPASFDLVHLSNILDWLDPGQARTTLDAAWNALRPGGWTLVRQLNSTLDIPHLGSRFEWHAGRARQLHAQDRSFFYRAIHLGRKR